MRKNPTPVRWRGHQAWLAPIAAALPFGMFDGKVKQLRELDIVEQIWEARPAEMKARISS